MIDHPLLFDEMRGEGLDELVRICRQYTSVVGWA
jgi:hypothetical protein